MTAVIPHGVDFSNLMEVATGRMLFETLQFIFFETIFINAYNLIYPLFASVYSFLLFTLVPQGINILSILFAIVTFDPTNFLISFGSLIDGWIFRLTYPGTKYI